MQLFSAEAKRLGLSNENAQKLVDVAVQTAAKQAKTQADAWLKQRETWVGEVKADKEIGGAKFDENMNLARKAISKFGSPALLEVLNSGWGDHPAFIRAFAAIGRALAEDHTIDGDPKKDPKSAESVLYPSHK